MMDWPPIDAPPRRLYPPHEECYPVGGPYPGREEYRAVLLDALRGVELGDYDRRMVDWIAGFDTSTVAVVVSLIHRAREVGTAGEGAGDPA